MERQLLFLSIIGNHKISAPHKVLSYQSRLSNYRRKGGHIRRIRTSTQHHEERRRFVHASGHQLWDRQGRGAGSLGAEEARPAAAVRDTVRVQDLRLWRNVVHVEVETEVGSLPGN